jgi:hypothetical protein
MFGIDKRITSSRYRSSYLVATSLAALFSWGSAANAAIPSLEPASAISPLDSDHFGAVLTVTELAGAAGNGGWIFTVTQTNALVAVFKVADSSQASGAGDTAKTPAGVMLALNGPVQPAMLTVTTAPAGSQLLQSQSATLSFDASVRYLCSDKIYADLYPNGKGWNNHAYSECQPEGAINPDRSAAPLNTTTQTATTPGLGGSSSILPCGGSVANVSTMTIGPSGSGPTMVNVGSAIASLSSFSLSALGRGHH